MRIGIPYEERGTTNAYPRVPNSRLRDNPGIYLSPTAPQSDIAAAQCRALDHLQALCENVKASGVKCDAGIRTGVPYQEIIRETERIALDLIVVGTQGATAIVRFMLGSTAERVLRHAPCPVLVARLSEQDRALDDGLGKLLGGSRATEVASEYLIFVQRLIDSLAHPVRKVAPVNMIEHHRGRKQKRERIGFPLTRKIRCRAMHRLENRGIDADVGGGSHAQPTHKACNFVRQNIAKKVGGEDHIRPS